MEDLFSLLVLGFFIWSMIGGLFGKKKPPQPRPRRQPGRPQPLPGEDAGRAETGRTPRPAARHHEEESAAEMIPDDLWSILTGETRRPTPQPAPPAEPEWEAEAGQGPRAESEPTPVGGAEPAPSWEPTSEPEWERRPDPEPSWEPTGPAAGRADAEPEERPVVVATPSYEETLSRTREPQGAPLQTPPPLPEIQSAHARERGAARRTTGAVRRTRRPRRASRARQRALRRAMVLREVLGPPRGLE